MQKTCKDCGTTKPIDDFYKNINVSDGHLNECKNCSKVRSRERRIVLLKDPAYVELERKRSRENRRKVGGNKTKPWPIEREAKEKYRKKFPEKHRARVYANRNLPKPSKGFNRHHWSYLPEHQLDVIVIPNNIHSKAHRFMRYSQEHKMYLTLSGTLLDTREKHEQYIESIKDLQ